MKPTMTAQRLLEGEKYVMVSLLVLYISGLQDGLNNALDYLKPPAPVDDAVEIVVKKYSVHDFDSRWGNGESVLAYGEGKRRQPQGFQQEQAIASALDLRTKSLYGIGAHENAKVWDIVSQRAVEIAAAKHGGREGATASSPTSGF